MFGARLKKERQRLGMNQDDFAEVGGVKKRAQISYEKDERSPDAAYLCALLEIGVDVWYVMTGQVSATALTLEESELLASYRNLDVRGKAGVLGLIDGMSTTVKAASGTKFSGNVSQVVDGDQTVNAPMTFHMTDKKKKKSI
ncbi:helix-turn-helix domain-containing protein [Collimonas sp. OK607]|uniref:helix-turn-helix domain-containing protein n=1 Tax=Collimonas sp. OK607 TaxID=1798194 RepID=UPI001FCD5D58|nr:helix-turn-helix transcriptional regulator [Collimonas sp. OK607]